MTRPGRRGPRFANTSKHPHYVYRCFDRDGRLIYVGCTNQPINRLAAHRRKAWWGEQIASTRLIVFPDRRHALSKEREAIATENPRWNVKGRWPHREDWKVSDYVDFRRAVVQAVETTHGQFGVTTSALLTAVDREVSERFGVVSIRRSAA